LQRTRGHDSSVMVGDVDQNNVSAAQEDRGQISNLSPIFEFCGPENTGSSATKAQRLEF